jgi:hypothetical protein
MTELLPRYYLAHDTPAGPRYAYPTPKLPELKQFGYSWRGDVEWVPTPDAAIEVGDKWIISDTMLQVVTATWRPTPARGDWTKRPEPPEGEIERKFWELSMVTPLAEDVEHYGGYGCDYDSCLRCRTLRVVYYRPEIEQPLERRPFDLSTWLPLPGELEPDQESTWVVDDDSLTAIYGTHTAHLWPGRLMGLRDAVYHTLKGDPRVSHVWTSAAGQVPRGHLEVVVPIAWEAPRTALVDRYGVRGRKLRGKERVPRTIAHSEHTTLLVPEGLHAATKNQALDAWADAIDAWVDRFIPGPRVVACDACDGHGYKIDNREDQK